MSLSIEPKKGIRLSMGSYSAIKTWQGGGKFWEHDFQLTVRQGDLQEFLPRVTDEGGSVLYEQVVDGNEAVSSSIPSSSLDQVPAAQIERLRRALAELKAKAEDPHCDANKRRMIEAFRLPDPRKDPELYRLHGSGRKKRLIVLWGVEKEAGSAIAPLQALDKMPGKTEGAPWTRRLWPLLLLFGIAIAAWFFLSGRSVPAEPSSVGGQSSSIVAPGLPPRVPERVTGGSEASNGPKSADSVGDGISVAPSNSANSRVAPRPEGRPNLDDADIDIAVAPLGAQPPNSPGDGVKDLPSPVGDSSVGGDNPTGPLSAIDAAAGEPGLSVAPEQKPEELGVALAPLSAPDAQKPEATLSPKADISSPDSPLHSTPETSPRRTDATTTGAPEEPLLFGSASPVPPALPVTSVGATRFKISAQPEGETLNGQVNVNLSAIGQNDSGDPVSGGFTITKWVVDGEVQFGSDGKELTSAALPVTLEKGLHRITVEGSSNGKAITSKADIDVSLKITEHSTVVVRPIEP